MIKKIKNISINEILEGKNWKLLDNEHLEFPMEETSIKEESNFIPTDRILYSGVLVSRSGVVTPIVLSKEINYIDYGGDYCWYVNGKWIQIGLVPNPDSESMDEYIANPLEIDPSYDSDHDFRLEHRENFFKWSKKLIGKQI